MGSLTLLMNYPASACNSLYSQAGNFKPYTGEPDLQVSSVLYPSQTWEVLRVVQTLLLLVLQDKALIEVLCAG